MIDAWDRLEGEPPRWYARFEVFRQLGSGRSVAACWRADTGRVGQEAPSRWNTSARRWRWAERALAWDQAQAQSVGADRREARAEARERHRQAGHLAWTKAMAMLTNVDPTTLTLEQAVKLLQAGIGWERGALDDDSIETMQRVVDGLLRQQTEGQA